PIPAIIASGVSKGTAPSLRSPARARRATRTAPPSARSSTARMIWPSRGTARSTWPTRGITASALSAPDAMTARDMRAVAVAIFAGLLLVFGRPDASLAAGRDLTGTTWNSALGDSITFVNGKPGKVAVKLTTVDKIIYRGDYDGKHLKLVNVDISNAS